MKLLLTKRLGAIGILFVTSFACRTPANPGGPISPDWPSLPPGARAVPFELIASESTSGFTATDRRVIDNQAEWTAFWRTLEANRTPKTNPPSIDFARRVVVAAMMGQRNESGYTIEIAGVFQTADRLLVRVLETSPGRDCVLLQVVTSPVTAVAFSRTNLPVELIERRATSSCGP